MQLITEEYRKLNEKKHQDSRLYGTSGYHYLDDIIALLKKYKTDDVLDYGCGKSTLANNLPFIIKQYDPAITKYSKMPSPADVVICTDVLEHIEPELIDNVLQHIASLLKKAGYLVANTAPAKKTLADGRNAHILVKPFSWWITKMQQYFEVVNYLEIANSSIFEVNPARQVIIEGIH